VYFPVVIDRGETAAQYRSDAWPTYFLIDKGGRVVWGFEHDAPSACRVEALLKE
jgi:hypothetical protein